MQKDSKNQLPLRKLYELEGMSPPLLFRKKLSLAHIFIIFFCHIILYYWASLVLQTVKNLPSEQEIQSGDLLEKGKATHSSTHASRIPWTEEPGG